VSIQPLETQRLLLRGWLPADLDDLYEYAKHHTEGWEPHASREVSLLALQKFIEEDDTWAIVLKESGKVIGQLRLYPDENRGQFSARNSAKLLNYTLSEAYWGKGYMTEAVTRVVEYAFDEMHIELLTAFHVPHNLRSRRVLEKCGFQYEGTIEQGHKRYDGQVFDSVLHSILRRRGENDANTSSQRG